MLPFIKIFNLSIPSYGLMMVIGLFLSAAICLWRSRKTNLVAEDIIVLIAATFGVAIFCGSFLYAIVTFSAEEIWHFIKTFNFTALFSGLVFYGSLIGGIVGGLCTAKILKLDLAQLEYCAVPVIPLGHAIGRIGCLLAGCCWGCVYNGAFAVSYPNAITSVSKTLTYFPIQAVEAIMDIVIMSILFYIARKPRRKLDLLSAYVAMYAVMRFITECFRGDEVRGIYLMFSTSQWISISLLAIVTVRFIVLKLKKKSV